MRVIVTRAGADAERTAAALRARGHEPLLSPVLEIVPTGAAIEPGEAQALIATSAHAFSGIDARVIATFAHLPLLVVGARTAEAAQRIGLAAPPLLCASAADLSTQAASVISPPSRLLYLAGHDRKPDLEAALARQGFAIDVVETYEARAVEALSPQVAEALKAGEADAVLHFSRRSARLFMDCAARAGLSAEAAGLRHVCISRDAASGLGVEAHVAETPDSAGVLKALEQI